MAGFAASVFAMDYGLSVAQVGNTGAIAYTSGYLDLLGYQNDRRLQDPWSGLQQLRVEEPNHPLSRIEQSDIRVAFDRFTAAISEMGVHYTPPGENNLQALSPAGTTKPTCSVPSTMLPGIQAAHTQTKALIVDFHGLEGFSATQLATNLKPNWPGLSARRMRFLDKEPSGALYPEVMARELEVPTLRQQFADQLNAELGDAEMIGMPAILGVHKPDQVHEDLQRLVGLPLFEIPTIPPGVPGIRLREMFEQQLPEQGLTLVAQQQVRRVELDNQAVVLHLQDSYGDVIIEAQAGIMATGRFLSGGLKADRAGIHENLLDLPVKQPLDREAWYRDSYFDPRGHEIHRAGIEVDDQFRPIGPDRKPVNKRLFAAGTLLSGQDWIRQRCGAGVAICSAYIATRSAADAIGVG